MTTMKPSSRAKATAKAHDKRVTKSLRSIKAAYQNQVDGLRDRLDANAAQQRAGYVLLVLAAMKERLGFEDFKSLAEIRRIDALFEPQIEAVADDVGRQAFVHHRYARAIEGALTIAAAFAAAPSPDHDAVDELLLDVRFLNRVMKLTAPPHTPPDYLVGTVFAPERDCMRVKEDA